MIIVKILFLLLLMIFTAAVGVLYYAPAYLPFDFLVTAKNLIHATHQTQDITFVVFYALVAVCLLCFILIVTTKSRRLKRRRKKLTKMFEQYGAKYAAEDKEINF